jgi:A/G-specific adenine glycosylase
MPKAAPRLLPAAKTEFQAALRAWYRRKARPLPWREAPTLYKTVVSEFMLQQTQVKTVLPYLARWLEALPDFAALAAAPEAQVLKLWEGLGYYTRARNLHRLARALGQMPELPRTPEAWRELPGVGPYTAAAITSIAFGAPAACVDGNVVRILARLTADGTPYRDSTAAAKALGPLANALLPADRPGNHNQAMMELGATVCSRQNPACPRCPVRRFCAAAHAGSPEKFPRLAPKTMEQRHVTRVWCESKGALLLHRSPTGARRFAEMHELPTAAQMGVAETTVAQFPLLARKRRGITRFQITESIHRAPPPAPRGKHAPDLVWVPVAGLETITLSGPHRRWVREILTRSAAAIPPPAASRP